MVFPICLDVSCDTSTLHFVTMKTLWNEAKPEFLALPVNMPQQWKFDKARFEIRNFKIEM